MMIITKYGKVVVTEGSVDGIEFNFNKNMTDFNEAEKLILEWAIKRLNEERQKYIDREIKEDVLEEKEETVIRERDEIRRVVKEVLEEELKDRLFDRLKDV